MPFTSVFGLNGQYFTYRDYWALTLGTYAGLQVISGIVVSLLFQRFGPERVGCKSSAARLKWKILASLIGLIYAFILVTLAIVNGLMVFGGQSIIVYMAVLLGVQMVFVLLGVFIRMPYLWEFLLSISNWSIAASVFFVIQIPSMFDYAASSLTWLIALAASVPLVVNAAFTDLRLTQSDTVGWSNRLRLNLRKVHFWLALVLAMAVGILLGFFLAGTCITVYDPNVNGTWIPFGGTVRWSSRMMRSLSYKPLCTGSDPCHVYLTAGADLTSEMFVTVHLASGTARNVSINILNSSNGYHSIQRSVVATEFPTPLLDSHDERLVYSAFLSNLEPGSEIGFSISTENGLVGDPVYFFKTAGPTGPLNFVVAGDSGVTTDAFGIMNQMVLTEPILAIIGGDIVYDNGFIACACSWDQWLTTWETKKVGGKYMIPISLAVGNHDIGINDNNQDAFGPQSGSNCDLTNTIHAKPLFFAWFPFETDHNDKVLGVCERTTMHVHYVPNLINLWILDSGYTVSGEANVQFVTDKLSNSTMGNSTNMAAYHVPLYSSNIEDVGLADYLITAWVSPLFDALQFALCFEHHAHTYKRTKPLFNNTIATTTTGTVYLGDGKFGIEGMAVPTASEVIQPSTDNFFETTGTQYHFFSVQIQNTRNVQVSAIDISGTTFDTLTVQ